MQESGQNGTDGTILGQLARGIHNRDRNIFLRLYQQYVRPHPGVCEPSLESLAGGRQRVPGKSSEEGCGHDCRPSRDSSERLKELGLTTMEERRHQLDMVQVY